MVTSSSIRFQWAVGQGFIINLCYILYVNDITCTLNFLDFIPFADDNTILYSHKDIKSKIDVVNEKKRKIKVQ